MVLFDIMSFSSLIMRFFFVFFFSDWQLDIGNSYIGIVLGLQSLSNVSHNKLKLAKQPTSSNVHLFCEPIPGCPAITTTNVDSAAKAAAVFWVYNIYSRCNNMLLYVKWLTCLLWCIQGRAAVKPITFRFASISVYNA